MPFKEQTKCVTIFRDKPTPTIHWQYTDSLWVGIQKCRSTICSFHECPRAVKSQPNNMFCNIQQTFANRKFKVQVTQKSKQCSLAFNTDIVTIQNGFKMGELTPNDFIINNNECIGQSFFHLHFRQTQKHKIISTSTRNETNATNLLHDSYTCSS